MQGSNRDYIKNSLRLGFPKIRGTFKRCYKKSIRDYIES